MRKLRKIISALMAGMTLFAMVPVNAETYNGEAVEDEVTQTEFPETSNSTKNSWEGVLDNTISWLRTLFLPQVFAAEDDIASGTSGGVTWVIDSEGTLTLSPTDGVSGQMESLSYSRWASPWYGYRTQIKKAITERGVALGKNANRLFWGCSNLTVIDLSNLDTSNVTNMSEMFYGCDGLTSLNSIMGWNTESVTNMSDMFGGCEGLTSLKPLARWKMESVTDMSSMFSLCRNLTSLEGLAGWDTKGVTNMSGMFSTCENLTSLEPLARWNTSSVTNMGSMFNDCYKVTSFDPLAKWVTSGVTNMSYMFGRCYNLHSLEPFAGWKTDSVTNMKYMFYVCVSLTSLEPLTGWVTDSVTNMESMFQGCSSLASLEGLAGWNVKNTTNMRYMFSDCSNLISLEPLTGWVTDNVTDMRAMFEGCSSLTSLEGLAGWNVKNTTNMRYMFSECKKLNSLEPLAGWVTSSVTDMSRMFYYCSKVDSADFSGWKIPSSKEYMLAACSSLSQITISTDFDFTNTGIPSPKTTDKYTGCWAYGDPWNHTETLTSSEFRNGTHKAGTWYWEQKIESPYSHYISKKENVFFPEYVEIYDNTSSLKYSPKELFPKDGYWQQQDNNAWVYTFYVYDNSIQWYVWEETVPDGYTSSATRENPIIIENGSIVSTITNTLDTMPKEYGKISIQKQLINSSEIAPQSDISFPFKVTITDESNNQLTGTKVFGGIAFQNGVAYLSVNPDETITINNIPAGYHYTVEELPDDRYVQEIANSSGIVQAESSEAATLSDNSAGLVVATNTRKQEEERPHENLTLRKEVTGNIDTEEAFNFVVSFNNLEPETAYNCGEQTFTSDEEGNANVNVHLKNGEEAVFENLPTGTRYRILEEAGDYTSSYTITDANNLGMINQTTDVNEAENEELATAMETVDAGEDVTATFTNNITKTQNISISKVVKDVEGETLTGNIRYEFTVEFSNTEPGTEIKSDLGILRTDDNGQVIASFYLANGETIKFADVPVDTQYRFTETENSATASYKITDTLENQSTVTAEATNDKPKQNLSTNTETVDNNEDAQITFTNTISNGSLTITKKDTNGEPLMGAEFTLTDAEGTVYAPEQVSTNSEGKITWTELPFGTYTLKETMAPAETTLMKESLTIDITSETPDVEISITDNSAIYLDAGGTGLITWMTISSAALALGTAFLLDTYKKKKRYGI